MHAVTHVVIICAPLGNRSCDQRASSGSGKTAGRYNSAYAKSLRTRSPATPGTPLKRAYRHRLPLPQSFPEALFIRADHEVTAEVVERQPGAYWDLQHLPQPGEAIGATPAGNPLTLNRTPSPPGGARMCSVRRPNTAL